MTEYMKILIVEDEPLIAMDLEDDLRDHGFDVYCAATVAEARKVMDDKKPDIAILDMHLRLETTFELATEFKKVGYPFFFVSGNDASALPEHLSMTRILTKPAQIADVLEEIRALSVSGASD